LRASVSSRRRRYSSTDSEFKGVRGTHRRRVLWLRWSWFGGHPVRSFGSGLAPPGNRKSRVESTPGPLAVVIRRGPARAVVNCASRTASRIAPRGRPVPNRSGCAARSVKNFSYQPVKLPAPINRGGDQQGRPCRRPFGSSCFLRSSGFFSPRRSSRRRVGCKTCGLGNKGRAPWPPFGRLLELA